MEFKKQISQLEDDLQTANDHLKEARKRKREPNDAVVDYLPDPQDRFKDFVCNPECIRRMREALGQ